MSEIETLQAALAQALDERDDARETAVRFEQEIAQMKPTYDLAVQAQEAHRAYRAAEDYHPGLHIRAQLFANRQHLTIALWGAS